MQQTNTGGFLSRLLSGLGSSSSQPSYAAEARTARPTPPPPPPRRDEPSLPPTRTPFARRPGVERYELVPSGAPESGELTGAPSFAVSKGDVVAIDIAFRGEPGDRLWQRVAADGQRFGELLQRELDAELGDAWENMVSVYRGSTHINIVMHSNDDEEPRRRSIFERAFGAVRRAVTAFVSFAKELWPHVKAVGCWIKRAAVRFLEVKHASDELADVFGFGDARHAAKRVIAWILGLWGFGPGLA